MFKVKASVEVENCSQESISFLFESKTEHRRPTNSKHFDLLGKKKNVAFKDSVGEDENDET